MELKLKLIPMLQYMHHDAALASRSRELLQELVSSYPSTRMVIVTLHTFTQLSVSALIHIPKQVCLNLLVYLKANAQIHTAEFWGAVLEAAQTRTMLGGGGG